MSRCLGDICTALCAVLRGRDALSVERVPLRMSTRTYQICLAAFGRLLQGLRAWLRVFRNWCKRVRAVTNLYAMCVAPFVTWVPSRRQHRAFHSDDRAVCAPLCNGIGRHHKQYAQRGNYKITLKGMSGCEALASGVVVARRDNCDACLRTAALTFWQARIGNLCHRASLRKHSLTPAPIL